MTYNSYYSYWYSAPSYYSSYSSGYGSSYGTKTYYGKYDCDPKNFGADTSDLIVMEAEDFAKCGFSTVCSTSGSGGEIVKISCGDWGRLKKDFPGEDGCYDVSIYAQDEADGAAKIKVFIGGELVSTVWLDQQTDGWGHDSGAFSKIDLGSFDIDYGDEIRIEAWKDCGEYVRLDKLAFEKCEEPEPVTCEVFVSFDGRCPQNDEMIDSYCGWNFYKDLIYATGQKDAVMTFTQLDTAGPVDITFDVFTTDISVFESNDTFKVQVKLDNGSWQTIDVFTRSGHEFVGSKTGQTYGTSSTSLFYTVGDATTDSVQLRLIADFSYCDENVVVDSVNFTLTCKPEEPAPTASLGDIVFHDLDADGVQDAGEAGIAGATVNLLDAAGAVIDTTTTDGDGTYRFDELAAGDYRVEFVQPSGYSEASPANQGGDDAADSDGVSNGTTFVSGIVSLDDGENDPTNDMGFYNLAGLGDTVFFDADEDGIQDAGEAGVDGVTVQLKDGTGTVVASTTTVNGGQYSFTGLMPGTYSVLFAAPAGYVFTAANAGADDALDSDADPVTGMTQQVTLTSGEFNGTLDAGLVIPNSAPVATDDAGKACATDALVIDVVADNGNGADSDADGDAIAVTGLIVDGNFIAVTDGGPAVTFSADGYDDISVTLNGSEFSFDATGSAQISGLLIGEKAQISVEYVIEDSEGAQDSAALDLTFCGSVNTLETIDAMLSGTEITYLVADVTTAAQLQDAWTLSLVSTTASEIPVGVYTAAYCIDSGADFAVDVLSSAIVSVATEANAIAAGVVIAENIDEVNWILNQDFTSVDNGDGNGLTFTDLEVQEAIWTLLNGDTLYFDTFPGLVPDNQNGVRDGNEIATRENVADIVEMALMNDGFEAGEGDIVGLIIDPFEPAAQVQPFIIGVAFDDLAQDCLCV